MLVAFIISVSIAIFMLIFIGAMINEEINARRFEKNMRNKYERRLP